MNNQAKTSPAGKGSSVTTHKNHSVYIVLCRNSTLYTGYTTNVEQRIAAHNAGKGARYTRAHRPVTLLVAWVFPTKSEALRAEYTIKHLPRTQKWQLVESPDLLSHVLKKLQDKKFEPE